ncbi:hypothetical protein V6N13_107392 [Hibiscus sabdariffa]
MTINGYRSLKQVSSFGFTVSSDSRRRIGYQVVEDICYTGLKLVSLKMDLKIEPDEKDGSGGDSDNGQLLRDIEEISKALYLHKPSSKALISTSDFRSKSVRRIRLSESEKYKKSSSLWDWKKPLKALTHIMQHRFRICFFLHVHSIEGLPAYLNDFNLCVHWKRKDELLSTRAVRVVDGIAEFEETLMCKCFVYGSRSGPHNSAKYENKLFVISVSVVDMSGHDIGQHWIDLARLLPLSLDDLEGEKGSGKWTTSFNLSGKAKGATLNVSFSFMVLKENLVESSGNMNASHFVNVTGKGSRTMGEVGVLHASKGNEMLRHGGTVPSNVNRRSLSVDVKFGAEVVPNLGVELSNSISILYQKFNEESLDGTLGLDKLSEHVEPLKPDSESTKDIDEYENNEFFVIDQGVEMCLKDPTTFEQSGIQTIDGSTIETINMDEILKDCDTDVEEEADPVSNMSCSSRMAKGVVDDHILEKSNIYSKPMTMRELESDFHDKLVTESSVSESSSTLDEFIEHEKCMEAKSQYEASKLTKKLPSLDDLADTVASDFLKMLEIEHDPFSFNSDSALESPRERLLREFENEALASGGFILDFGAAGEEEFNSTIPGPCCGDSYEDFTFHSVMPGKEQKMERLSLKDRRAVKAVEDLETAALMHEGSLDDKAFQSPPHTLHSREGWACFASYEFHTFRNCKNVGHLVSYKYPEQLYFLQDWVTDITETTKLCFTWNGEPVLAGKINNLMYLKDIAGKPLQQIALEAAPRVVMLEWYVIICWSIGETSARKHGLPGNNFIPAVMVERASGSPEKGIYSTMLEEDYDENAESREAYEKGEGTSRKELADSSPHSRTPDVILEIKVDIGLMQDFAVRY